MGFFTNKDSITYIEKDRKINKIPFVHVAYYFVQWNRLSRDERKKKFDEMLIAGKFGAGLKRRGMLETKYNPPNKLEKDKDPQYENAFSDGFILASLPDFILLQSQRSDKGDDKWKKTFRYLISKNVHKYIKNIIWTELPEAYKHAEFFNDSNALLAFGLGTREQLAAFEAKREVARDKKHKKYDEAKVTFIACMCGNVKNGLCRCKTTLNGIKGGSASEKWYNSVTGKLVTNFDEEVRKTCVSAKCIFVECKCEGGTECRCKKGPNGNKGGNASEDWFDKVTRERVYTFDEESRKTCVNAKCIFVECKGGRNCRCMKGPNGIKGGNASEHWLDKVTRKPVYTFDEEARKTCVNAKCIFVECHCGKKSECRCKTTRFIGLKRVKGDTANGMWFDESGERLYSFPKGTKAINARCIQRVCAGSCGRTGYASTINNKSPLLEKEEEEYLCRNCATLDVFTDERGCPFCGKRWTGCSTEPNDMQFCMDRDRTKRFWESEGKIGLLDRTAHMNCWRETHNEMLKLRDVEKEKNIGTGVSLQDASKKIKAMIKGEMKKILDADVDGTLKRTFEAAKEERKKKENERKSAREALANEYAVKLKELMTKEPDQK